MAARSSWKGYLKLSLVSVPVKAFTANSSGASDVRLNQLHADCHSRIQYKKTCPIHGEVKQDGIVSGFEHAKDQYVVIDTDELEKLRTEDDKAIKLEKFIHPDTLDPIYNAGKTYYLAPDGPVAQGPYAVIQKAMAEEKLCAIAEVVMHGKEQVVLVRPIGRLLAMTMLHLDAEVTKPTVFESEVPPVTVSPEEVTLAKTLVKSQMADKLDYAQYRDLYTERLTKLIQAKVEGKEIVVPPAPAQAHVINLMDALKQSVAQAQVGAETAEKPPKKMAGGIKKPAAAKKKKQA
jgi:DNA end-binding protein Ku